MTVQPYETATIANATTTSDRVNLRGLRVGAILFPAGFTGATISFELPDGGTAWATLNGITLTPVVSKFVALTEAQAWALGDDFRIVSASSEGAERILKIAPRGN